MLPVTNSTFSTPRSSASVAACATISAERSSPPNVAGATSSAKSQVMLRAATLERLMHDDGDDPAANVFSLRTIAMATRDFSSNPSKALRHAGEALVMVTKYNRPIALLVSIDDWNRLLGEVRETSLTRLSFDAAAAQGVRPVALSESSLN